MEETKPEIMRATATGSNMPDYEQARAAFQWDDIISTFSWHETGLVNMGYEAIDRHAESERADKIALHYSDATREESYSFAQMKAQSNKFGNVLRHLNIAKGDRVFIFMPRSPELYFALLGTIKIGAIAGPLFEAFMETAVRDRLQDSGAVAIVTTPALLPRVPVGELPELKHVILVGAEGELQDGQTNYAAAMAEASEQLDIEWVDREDGLLLH